MPEPLAGLEEARLCRLLAAGPWAGQRMIVVCDGAAHPLRFTESPTDAVELMFSGAHRTADDVIIELIKRDSAPRRLTVVSTDHAIRRAARRRRARILTSEQFVGCLMKMRAAERRAPDTGAAHAPKPPAGPLSEGEVRQWLEAFGVADGPDSPGPDTLPWEYDSD